MTTPVTAPANGEVQGAFSAALRADAVASPPEIPPPPRLAVSVDPVAPHGRSEAGEPLAPFGVKSDGSPRLKAAGPGRGHRKDDEPRVQRSAPRHAAPSADPATAGGDYTDALAGLGYGAWMASASCRGGKILGVNLPDLRPYAHALHESLPGMIGAMNVAAQQNQTIRNFVERAAGQGSFSWVFGMAFATAPFLGACAQLSRKTDEAAELRDQAAELSDTELREFLTRQFGQAPELQAA